MSKYLETKKGSLEDMVAGVTEGKQSEDYKQLFKKELEKTGKGVGSMSDVEKKAFFNNIDKKHKAKNEGSKEIQTKNMRTTPGEGTGAVGGPKLNDTSVKKSLKASHCSESVEESAASDQAKSMGLTYLKFGRYGKNGTVTHKSDGGALRKFDPKTGKLGDKEKPKFKKMSVADVNVDDIKGNELKIPSVANPSELVRGLKDKYGDKYKVTNGPTSVTITKNKSDDTTSLSSKETEQEVQKLKDKIGLYKKDGSPSAGKLKSLIQYKVRSQSGAGDNLGFIEYEYKGSDTLEMDADEPDELVKVLKKKFGDYLDIKDDGMSTVTAKVKNFDSVKEDMKEEDNSLVSQVAKEISKRALKEGGVKDFLMDVEDDAAHMSLNDLIKKYYNQMGLSAQDLKKIFYRVNESANEELTAGQKKLPPALQKAIKDKEDKKSIKASHCSEETEEEEKTIEQTIHDVWNNAAAEEEKREEEAKYYKTEEKKSITEEKIKCPNCGHMNDADAQKCSNCGASLKSESKDSNKKKTMTGSPATKVDTTPEVEYEH